MALGSISSADARPIDIVTATTASATDWEDLILPYWARSVTIQNPGGSTVYVGRGEAGAYVSGGYRILPGDELTVPLSADRAGARTAPERTIQLFAGASGYSLTFLVAE